MNKKTILWTFLALLISSTVFFVGFTEAKEPQTIYKVYLDGKELGQIKSKKELENYINDSQNELKEKYGVSTVHLPNNLSIEKEITYMPKISSASKIYEKLKEEAPFTVRGYEITIGEGKKYSHDGDTKVEAKKLYVLDKEIFKRALKKTVLAFITEEEYESYINGNIRAIEDYGKRTESIKIANNIVIKESNISAEEEIFLDEESLGKHLLFGGGDFLNEYIVQGNEDIETVAFNNKLSTKELMIANPELTSEESLLYSGQKLNVALINPMFRLEKNEYVVESLTKEFNVIIEKDPNLSSGAERVKQEGVNGLSKISSRYKYVNGQLGDIERISEEQISAPINKIIVRGTKYIPNVGSLGTWAWPTLFRNVSSEFEWRNYKNSRKFHKAIDINGGLGEPIFAANNGTVIESKYDYKGGGGNLIYIDHNNGYVTEYAHLNSRSVVVGQTVSIGERIGGMGSTGNSTGVHLHFGVWIGLPHKGEAINPRLLYR